MEKKLQFHFRLQRSWHENRRIHLLGKRLTAAALGTHCSLLPDRSHAGSVNHGLDHRVTAHA